MKRGCMISSLVLVCLVSLCLHVDALGREGTFGLYPAEFRGVISPGQSGMFELFVFNNTNQTSEFAVSIMGCGIDRSGARYYPSPEESGDYSAAKWLTLTGMHVDSNIRLSPNERHALLVEVHVPIGTRPGEYYAVVFVEPVEFSVVEQGSLRFQTKSRIGAVVKVLVPGPISAFDMRSSVSEISVVLPDAGTVEQFRSILETLERDMVVTDSCAPELARLLRTFGTKFVYDDYRAWQTEKQEEYVTWATKFLEQIWIEEETVKIVATLSTESRKIILAKGEVSIYQEFVNESGKRQRILRDHFTLTPAGSSIKGEEKVFPGGMRDFFGTIQRPLPVGEYTVDIRFEYRGEDEEDVRFALGQTTFSVPEELAIRQKEMLVLGVDSDLLVYDMAPGEYHVEAVTLENLDVVEPLEIQLSTNASWIDLSLSSYKLQPGRRQSVRIAVRIPRDAEFVDRAGKVLISTDRGKAVYIDVQVRDKRDIN